MLYVALTSLGFAAGLTLGLVSRLFWHTAKYQAFLAAGKAKRKAQRAAIKLGRESIPAMAGRRHG